MRSFFLPVRNLDGRVVVVLPAEMDFTNSSAVLDALLALLARGPSDLVADMSGTSFCDVSGVRAVVRAHRRAQMLGCRLSVVITRPFIRRIFMLTGADTTLRIYPTIRQALTWYGADADNPPGRPPKGDAPGMPRPEAPRTVASPPPDTIPARHRHRNGTAASDATLNTGHQGKHAAEPANAPDTPGQPAPEGQTHALRARLHEAISLSGELRSQSAGVFARLAVTYGELADLAEQLALQHTLGVEHLKAVSVTARDRSIDCRQLAMEKSRPSLAHPAG